MWGTRHADFHASDYIDIEGPAQFKVGWRSLKNIPAATFCGYDSKGNCYLATLNEPKENCGTVWSLTSEGELRWQVDSMLPSLTSLAVDPAGNVYLDDGCQLVSLDCHGNTRWKLTTREETAAVVFLPDGNLFIQNVSGDINIYDSEGRILLDSYRIDCAAMEKGCDHGHMPGRVGRFVFEKAVERIGVSRNYSSRMINRFLGVGISSKHVPVIVPELNRVIVVVALGEGESAIYGLDIDSNDPKKVSLRQGFKTLIPGGADTSPSVSFDGMRVYCTDGGGICYCLSTETGEVLWQLQLSDTSSASPSVSPDGYLYISVKSKVIAIKDHGGYGEIVWDQAFHELNQQQPDLQLVANSVLAVNKSYVYGVVSVGEMKFKKLMPKDSYLVSMDRISGKVAGLTPLDHESLCTISIMPCGSVLVPSKPIMYGLKNYFDQLKRIFLFRRAQPLDFHGLVLLKAG